MITWCKLRHHILECWVSSKSFVYASWQGTVLMWVTYLSQIIVIRKRFCFDARYLQSKQNEPQTITPQSLCVHVSIQPSVSNTHKHSTHWCLALIPTDCTCFHMLVTVMWWCKGQCIRLVTNKTPCHCRQPPSLWLSSAYRLGPNTCIKWFCDHSE